MSCTQGYKSHPGGTYKPTSFYPIQRSSLWKSHREGVNFKTKFGSPQTGRLLNGALGPHRKNKFGYALHIFQGS